MVLQVVRHFVGASVVFSALVGRAFAQGSDFALHFYGAEAGGGDRARVQIDDNHPGVDHSEPIDLGGGSFTLEFWVKGALGDNPTAHAGGDMEFADESWRAGNHVIDRDVDAGTQRRWGVSLAGGFVRFGTGAGDQGADQAHTLEGDRNVLDGAWHHVACVRDALSGVKRVFVDGQLDVESAPGVSHSDLSFPDDGVPGQSSPLGQWMYLGARKFADASASSGGPYSGYLDELRLWRTARSANELAATYASVLDYDTPDLVGYYRFEEAVGTSLHDSSSFHSRVAQLLSGVPGEGEWVSRLAASEGVAPVVETTLPNGFVRRMLAIGFDEPTCLACAPDGRVFVGQRSGAVRLYGPGGLRNSPVIQLPTDTLEGERGLISLVLDPQFASNGWFYVLHTTPEPRERVSRFTLIGDHATPASEFVVWESAELAPTVHLGGGLAFGADQMLWLATGDGSTPAASRDLSSPRGKLLRLGPDGSIPADNPLVGLSGVDPAVWAWGLRNPFRLAVDRTTGELWIGDVGGNTASAWEELNRAVAGADYGWPNQEGAVCALGDCASLTSPAWAYPHDDPEFVVGVQQACIVLGDVYRGASYPPQFQGNVFVADYANRWIRRVVLDSQGAVSAAPIFLRAPYAGSIVDLEVGPDGALYYVNIGYQNFGEPELAALQRIEYVGVVNQQPVAVAAASPSSGLATLDVQFSSAGSFDPDAAPSALEFLWDFGDGTFSTDPSPQHAYALDGAYFALLRVSDGADFAVAAPLEIRVGNAPAPLIASPSPGATFCLGQSIAFSGSATDIEDGPLSETQLTWRVFLVHADHLHPAFGPVIGASGAFLLPSDAHDHDVFYRVVLEAVDSSGLRSTASVDVLPPVRTYCTSSTSTNGCHAAIGASGMPSASAGSGFLLACGELEGQRSALFFYGINGPVAAPWGSGGTSLRCVRSPVQRMTALDSGGNAGACDGQISLDWNTYRATHPNALGAPFAGGQSVWTQAWFRDPPAVKATNMSNALEFTLCP
ncbi:MAG: PQQ-dependent sugar dehydrogenase [Planctomycetes bacterium]|nr:PQQ-dependent sugar dehydrogenase [Planctomycetota bacterium]